MLVILISVWPNRPASSVIGAPLLIRRGWRNVRWNNLLSNHPLGMLTTIASTAQAHEQLKLFSKTPAVSPPPSCNRSLLRDHWDRCSRYQMYQGEDRCRGRSCSSLESRLSP